MSLARPVRSDLGIQAYVELRSTEYTASTKRVAEMAFKELSKEFDAKVSAAGGLGSPGTWESFSGGIQSRKESLKAVLKDRKYAAVVFEKMKDKTFEDQLTALGLTEEVGPFVNEEAANLSIAFYQHCEDVTSLYHRYFGNDEEDGEVSGVNDDLSMSEDLMKVEDIQTMASSLQFVADPKYAFLTRDPSEKIQSTVELVTQAYIRLEVERDVLCARLGKAIKSGGSVEEKVKTDALDLLNVTIRPKESLMGERARLIVALASLPVAKKSELPSSRLSMTGVLVGGVAVASLAAMGWFGRDSLRAIFKNG